MSVSLVKSTGRHAARMLNESVVACPAMPGNTVAYVVRNGRLAATGTARRSNGPRHLCSAFDLDTTHRESRCDIADCDCTVRLTSGSWVRGDASFVLDVPFGWDRIEADDAPLSVLTDVVA